MTSKPSPPRFSRRPGFVLGMFGAAAGCLAFGLAGLVGNALHPAVSPSWRLLVPFLLLVVGALWLVFSGLLYRSARQDGRLSPHVFRTPVGVLALAVGVGVGLLIAFTVPVPAVTGVQLAAGPFAPVVPGACYSYEDNEALSLPVQSNVRVHWLLGGSGGSPYVNVTDPSGTFVYQGGPGSSGSGSFTVPAASSTPLYVVAWAVLVCTPGSSATLSIWVNATQGGPLV